MSPKDADKMVAATAKAMALADVGGGTPPIVRHYVDDARKVLVDVLKAAKRQGWRLDELLAALEPRKPAPGASNTYQDPPPRRSGP